MIGRNLDGPFKIPPRNANQARFIRVVGVAGGIGLQLVEELAKCRIDAFFMSQSAQSRALATPGTGAANWYVGCMVPTECSPPLQ